MLTPQEVAGHTFAKASFGGYNMGMVDEFLDLVTADYSALYKENAALKAKMKVLADKVEEYRSTEDAMRKALLAAQKMADQLVAEAEEKKNTIVSDAEQEARGKIAAIQQEVANEQLRLTAAQNATTAYITKLKELYQNELEYIGSLSNLTAQPARLDAVDRAAELIGDAVEKAVEEELGTAEEELPREEPKEDPDVYEELKWESRIPAADPAEPVEEEEEEPELELEEDDSPTRRIDFDHLKFGKDYEIE